MRENVVAREVQYAGDIVEVHILDVFLCRARLQHLTVTVPDLLSSLAVRFFLVSLQSFSLEALSLCEGVDAILAISLKLFYSVFDFLLFTDAGNQLLILVNILNARYKFEFV